MRVGCRGIILARSFGRKTAANVQLLSKAAEEGKRTEHMHNRRDQPSEMA
jgi:hypothetical protein